MGGDAVAVERDRASGGGEQRQQAGIARGRGIGQQLEPRVHIGDRGGRALRRDEQLLLAGVLDRFAGAAVKAGERRAGRQRDAAQLRIAREQGAPLRRPLGHQRAVGERVDAETGERERRDRQNDAHDGGHPALRSRPPT